MIETHCNSPKLMKAWDNVVNPAVGKRATREAMYAMGAEIGVCMWTHSYITADDNVVLYTILRGALPFTNGIADGIPVDPIIAHLGFRRVGNPPTAELYYRPPGGEYTGCTKDARNVVVLCDFALADAATKGAALQELPVLEGKDGYDGEVIVACGVVAPEGVENIARKYPNLKIVWGITGEGLDDDCMILPWVIDYGDKAFGC